MTIIPYLDQLKTKCRAQGIWLHQAFKASKVDISTYSRSIRNKSELRLGTALKVDAAIDVLVAKAAPEKPPKNRKGLSVVDRDS